MPERRNRSLAAISWIAMSWTVCVLVVDARRSGVCARAARARVRRPRRSRCRHRRLRQIAVCVHFCETRRYGLRGFLLGLGCGPWAPRSRRSCIGFLLDLIFPDS